MGTFIGCVPGCTAVCGSCRHFCSSPTEWPRPTAPNRGWGVCSARKRGGCGGGRVSRVLPNVAPKSPPRLREGVPAARACRGSLRAPAAPRAAAWCTNKDLRHVRTWQAGWIMHLLLQLPPLLFPPLLPPLPQGALTGERVLCRLAGGLRRLRLLAQQLVLCLQAENLCLLPCPSPRLPLPALPVLPPGGWSWGEGAWSP